MFLIHRSILKDLIISFSVTIIFLNFGLMMEKLLRLSRLLAGAGSSITDFLKIVFFIQPQILIYTIPMSMLLSILLVYGRMSIDNELVILRGAGMSFWNISRPVLYFGIACFSIGVIMSFYLGPRSSSMLWEKISEILTIKAPMSIEEGVFNTSFKDIVILVKEKPSTNQLSGIFILDERQKDEPKVIVSKEGRIIPEDNSISFLLKQGQILVSKDDSYTEISFGKYYFRLNPFIEHKGKGRKELTPLELLKASAESSENKNKYLVEFHRRLSMPALCLILIFLGPSLSLFYGKSGRLGGLTIGLMVFVIYYIVLIYGENLSIAGKIHHLIGSWIAFIMLGATSIYIFINANKR